MPATSETPPLETQPAWHASSTDHVVAKLETAADAGLSDDEAARRLETFGENVLPGVARPSSLRLFARQFKSPLVYLLLIAAALALVLGETGDAAVVVAVVLTNSFIGWLQETRAEKSLAALRRLAGAHARVLRSGREREIETRA